MQYVASGYWQAGYADGDAAGSHAVTARPVVQGSTINAPGLVQTHVVTARPVVQASTVRVAGIAPPFVRSMYLAAVPAGEYSATVPAGNYRASI